MLAARYFAPRYFAHRYFATRPDGTDDYTPTLPSSEPEPLFGWPIYSDASVRYTPTFSGGSWRASLPLANLADRRLARIARSANALLASTTFDVDLKTARPIGLLALPKHTLSSSAQVRWRASDSPSGFGAPIYDSDWLDVWPAGQDAETLDGLNLSHVLIPDDDVIAQYWRCEIDDTGNAAGYVDLARVVIAGVWRPSTGLQVGAKLTMESATERLVSDGGAAHYRPRPMRRLWDFTVPNIEEIEAFDTVWPMLRRIGTHGQLFFVFDTADPFMHERAFLATLRELSAIEYPHADANAIPFRVLEEL